jgi:hypothetical protein
VIGYRIWFWEVSGAIFLHAHAPAEEKINDSKDSLYEELEQFFYHFLKYNMKIMLGDFNAELGREDIFKPTTGNESLHRASMIVVLES